MTPEPPYYAVIFSSQRTERDAGYGEMADLMDQLASEQPGFLGVESVRDVSGAGITVSYWTTREAIAAWKQHVSHRVAQSRRASRPVRLVFASGSLEIRCTS